MAEICRSPNHPIRIILRSIHYLATLLVTFLVSFTPPGFAQIVFETYLESEEAINEAYYRGELSYEQYQDLLDLYFNRIDLGDEDLSRLEVVPGATRSDLNRIRDVFQENDSETVARILTEDLDLRQYLPFINVRSPSNREMNLRAYWQTNLDFAEGASESGGDKSHFQFRMRLNPHYEILFQGEKRYFDQAEVSKRFIKVQNVGFMRELILGNFTAGYGNGLNLGRYDYWRYNTDSYWEERGDLFIPNSTWYNGIKASLLNGSLQPDIVYSYYEGDSLKRNLFGANLTWRGGSFSPGVTYSVDLTEDGEGGQLQNECLSLHTSLRGRKTEVGGEAALLNSDYAAVNLQFLLTERDYSTEFRFWGYSDGFVNFHTSSKANPDYFTVYYDEIDYDFRCPQAGEIGFSSSNRFKITDRLYGKANFSGWGNRVRKTDNYDLQLGFIARWSQLFSLRFDQFIKNRDNQEEPYQSYTSQLEVRSHHLRDLPVESKISYNLKEYEMAGKRDYAYFWLRVGFLKLKPLEIFSRIKYVYQELKYSTKKYCELYLQERVDFWEGFNLQVKYRANYRGLVAEDKEIRVRLQALW